MLWNDLREFVAKLEELGDLKTIQGAHWDLEIGAINETMVERGGPALLFDGIPDYPPGFRVATNLNRTPRHVALSLGLDHEVSIEEMATEWERTMGAYEPVPPVEVEWGPVLENVITGDDVDLFKFPTPNWHENDGSRYIGTGVCVIQRDHETGYVNSGTYRVSIQDAKTCGLFMEPDNHGDTIRRKYWSKGEKCPVVIAVGQEPVLTMVSGGQMTRTPYGTSEFEVAGYIHKSPYPVIKGALTGLPIPASAEIVIEGFIPSPDERMMPEGPFGEWTGYYAHGRRPETVIEVGAIYHRNDPILFGSPPVWPLRTYKEIRYFDLKTKARLEAAGLKGIVSVYWLTRPAFSAVSIKQMYEGHVDDVIRVLEPGGDQHSGNHFWILVDDDVDVSNTEEVLWALGSRCIPETGVRVIPGTAQWQLDPRIPPGEQSDPSVKGRTRYSAHSLVLNACRPFAWKDQFPKVNRNSPETRAKFETKWSHLFVGLPEL